MLRNMQSMHWMYRMPVLFEIKSVSQHWPIGRPPKHAGLIGPAMWPPAPAILSAVQPTAHCTLHMLHSVHCSLHTLHSVQKVQCRETWEQSREGLLAVPWNGCHPEMKVERRKAFWTLTFFLKDEALFVASIKDYKYLSFRWTNRFLTRVEQDLTVHIWNIRLDVVLELRD